MAIIMHFFIYIFLAVTLAAISSLSYAISIGTMNATMEADEDFLTRTVVNNSTTTKVYEVSLVKVSNPTASGTTLSMPVGELLYAPKRFTLHPNKRQHVKFYYKGHADNQERYYRAIFTESPTAQPDDYVRAPLNGALDMNVELQSILVVRPRKSTFDYAINPVLSTISNTGNTYFEFMVKDGCDQPDDEADSKYLLPGDTWQNAKISQKGNQKFIVYQSKFIPVGEDCWLK